MKFGTVKIYMEKECRKLIYLPFPRYIWNIIKNTTRAERLISTFAIVALIVIIALILTFTLKVEVAIEEDVAPHDWNITRDMWLAEPANETQTTEPFEPLRLVVIQHTVSTDCPRFILCAAEIRNLQSYYLNSLGYDIPYNFIIGNDGRVYEGRGFGLVGAHTYGYNSCTIGLGFIGDYREELPVYSKVTPLQVKNVQRLLDEAVRRGLLHPDYHVVGAKDLASTQSPGSNLYNEIQKWPHYDHKGLYRNKTCTQIRAMYENPTVA